MRDEPWAEVEAAFFAAGDETSQHQDGVTFDADDLAAFGTSTAPEPSRMRVQLAATRAELEAALGRARRSLQWHARMLQFRLTVMLFAGAEHALRAAKTVRFHPLRVARRPWLVRACVVVLLTSASSYSAAAVLVASGAL